MNDTREKSVDQVYDEFWKLIVEKDGNIDYEQIKKELYDFCVLIDNVSKVYCHVTGNQISKPLTDPDVVMAVADEHYDEICQEYVKELRSDMKNPKPGLTYEQNCLFVSSAVFVGVVLALWLMGLLPWN